MERVNFRAIEKKWQKKFANFKLSKPKGKSSTVEKKTTSIFSRIKKLASKKPK